MRTTINLDDDVLQNAKSYALEKQKSLSLVIEEAVREVLARKHNKSVSERRIRLPTVKGRRLAHINYDSTAALLELSERDSA